VSDTALLIPLDGSAELMDWLDEFGMHPDDRAMRAPGLGEVRAAIRALRPVEFEESGPADGRWHAIVRFGPVTTTSAGVHSYAAGFEVSADVDEPDDDATAGSLAVRGGDRDLVLALARAVAAAIGPVIAVWASEGVPEIVV
jgi:hypothetical protein